VPAVSQTFRININNDPAENAIAQGDRAVYLDMLLSEHYGKMVRQGCSFKVTGIQASLQPDPSSSGIDVGMSVDCKLNYVPAVKHSRFAWNKVYQAWRRQKNLATAVGGQVRYDDMEYGWDSKEGVDRSRTSTIFGSGMSDDSQEKLVLTGVSTQTAGLTVGQYSLQDYYNSAYETPEASRDPFTNTDIKEPKWGATPFPEVQYVACSATSSAVGWYEGSNKFGGAITIGDVQTLSEPINSLCGIFMVEAFVMPDDTVSQDEDDFILTVTWFVKSWKSLVAHRGKSRRGRGRSYRKGGRAGGRYYRKRTRRRR
jgi:hypothetical protein